jgi:hypothetical protein
MLIEFLPPVQTQNNREKPHTQAGIFRSTMDIPFAQSTF